MMSYCNRWESVHPNGVMRLTTLSVRQALWQTDVVVRESCFVGWKWLTQKEMWTLQQTDCPCDVWVCLN